MSLFCTNYDLVIVGGGISGLFLAYKLCETNLKILLLEKDSNLGGRIHTIKKEDYTYECGAARFNQNHTKLLTLINELDLQDKMIQLSSDINEKVRKYQTKNNLNIDYLFNVLRKKYEDLDDTYLQNITFYQLLTQIFDNETAEYIKDAFGYDSEFIHLNALAAMTMFKDDLFKKTSYYILKDGLSQIIETIELYLSFKKNVTILKKNNLKKIFDDKIETSIDTYYYKNLILAIPQFNLKNLNEFKDFKELDSVQPIQLLRIYAKYPIKNKKDGVWFKNIKRTTTNNYIRHIIPIDYEKGLIMISYVDCHYANMLHSMYLNGKQALINAIHKEIRTLFNINPPEPEELFVHNWDKEYAGVHMWKTGYNINELYPKIMQPDPKKNIFICGETYSKKQCWIEGALETCYDVLKLIKFKDINITFSKELEEEKKIDKKIIKKKYTIQEVLKKDKWIILEVNGKKNIYDVSKWIPIHPGGTAIFRGIDANKYYLKNSGVEKSPIELFNQIGSHHSEMVKENYLLKENEYVVLVGELK